MQKISSPDNLFHDGDPTTGALGTIVNAAFMNAVQAEIIAPITAAGLILDPTNSGQLLAAILALIESKTGNYALDTGQANAYVVALAPAVTAYTNGLPVKFRPTHSNTGQSTLDVGAGPKALLRDDGTPLQAGDMPANAIVSAIYDAVSAAFLLNSVVASQFDTLMQSGAPLYSVDTGSANVYKAAYAPTITALTDGMKLRFRAKTANTGPSTFAPDGIAAAPIWGGSHVALAGGEIAVNGENEVQWNAALNGNNGVWVLCENSGGARQISGGSYLSADPAANDNSSKVSSTRWIWNNIQSLVSGCISAVATAAGFSYSFGPNGYFKFPSWLAGLIIDWGVGTFSTGGSPVTFPIAFPNALYGVYLGNPDSTSVVPATSANSQNGFTGTISAGSAANIYWLAIGR